MLTPINYLLNLKVVEVEWFYQSCTLSKDAIKSDDMSILLHIDPHAHIPVVTLILLLLTKSIRKE